MHLSGFNLHCVLLQYLSYWLQNRESGIWFSSLEKIKSGITLGLYFCVVATAGIGHRLPPDSWVTLLLQLATAGL